MTGPADPWAAYPIVKAGGDSAQAASSERASGSAASSSASSKDGGGKESSSDPWAAYPLVKPGGGSESPKPEGTPSRWGSSEEAASGMSLGLYPYVAAAGRAAGGALAGDGFDYGKSLEAVRQDREAYQQQHPAASIAAGVAGGLAMPGMMPASPIVKGVDAVTKLVPTQIGKAAVGGALIGGGVGGVQGFIDTPGGDGSLGDQVMKRIQGAGHGALVGAGVGAALPALATGVLQGGKATLDAIRSATAPLTDAGNAAEAAAAKAFQASAADPAALPAYVDQAISQRMTPGGSPHSVAQASNDPGLLSLERTVNASSPEATAIAKGLQSDQNQAVTAGLRSIFPEITDAQMASAQAAVTKELASIGGGAEPEQVGKAIRSVLQKGLDTAKDARSAAVDPLYEAARASTTPVNIDPVLAHINERLAVTKGPIRQAIQQAHDDLFVGTAPDTSAAGLMESRKSISERINRFGADGLGPQAKAELLTIREKLDNALQAVPEIEAANAKFAEMSPEVNKFTQGPAGEVTAKDTFGKAYETPDSGVTSQFFGKGPGYHEATGQLVEAIGKPAAGAALRDTIGNAIMRDAVDATGKVDPRKLASVVGRYSDSLKHFPDLEFNLQSASAAQSTVDRLAADKAMTEKFWKATVNSERDAKGDLIVNGNQVRKFLDANEADLTRMVGADGFQRLRALQHEIETAERSARVRLPGSDTAQKLSGMSVIGALVKDTIKHNLGAGVGGGLGFLLGGGPIGIGIGGMAGKGIDAALTAAAERQAHTVNRLIARANSDPEVLRTLLMKVNDLNRPKIQQRLRAHLLALPAADVATRH